ncbi:TPA: restriction endonuclease [Yersinia enterocolitica]|uniref:Restriction endonuclease type IV Mrr domain-containing protein n=1 Tax=Yersinia enterocolitica TaxID=630 RepID=B0RKY4_YEREN|nr:restriction endonuclease [Yersinia enterocolitica]AKF40333.1 hypothetical protein FORC2_p055 [Yersinia enterocolitica]ALG47336.1 restriction endonuclease [Yersinia enterocolitica]EKN3829037.1 restriction endonuclease [Yersinia enterocolitica]EKN3882900.1 restriction endonuclease [Yersinia enterocolitica]EKN4012433.1 restriction endonuclease [Yersinia enterocolitica]
MKFTVQDIKIFDELFKSSSGYVLDFSDRTMRNFFEEELSIDIDDEIYQEDGSSKAKRLRCFIKKTDRESVLIVLDKLWNYRKVMASEVITPREEILYSQFIDRLKKSDVISAQGIKPSTIIAINTIEYGYYIKELESMKELLPQNRGYRFEKWLSELFAAFQLSPNSGFRITGEQIDGSFILHNETYLVEAKWHSKKTAAADLHVFQGKLDQKATWARGVFISWQGFSPDAFIAWGRAKSVICVTGYDLYHMLTNNISLIDMLEKKIRIAAEKGEYNTSIDALYPDIIKIKKV